MNSLLLKGLSFGGHLVLEGQEPITIWAPGKVCYQSTRKKPKTKVTLPMFTVAFFL